MDAGVDILHFLEHFKDDSKSRGVSKVSQIATMFQPQDVHGGKEDCQGPSQATVVRTESHVARFNSARALFEKMTEQKGGVSGELRPMKSGSCPKHCHGGSLNFGGRATHHSATGKPASRSPSPPTSLIHSNGFSSHSGKSIASSSSIATISSLSTTPPSTAAFHSTSQTPSITPMLPNSSCVNILSPHTFSESNDVYCRGKWQPVIKSELLKREKVNNLSRERKFDSGKIKPDDLCRAKHNSGNIKLSTDDHNRKKSDLCNCRPSCIDTGNSNSFYYCGRDVASAKCDCRPEYDASACRQDAVSKKSSATSTKLESSSKEEASAKLYAENKFPYCSGNCNPSFTSAKPDPKFLSAKIDRDSKPAKPTKPESLADKRFTSHLQNQQLIQRHKNWFQSYSKAKSPLTSPNQTEAVHSVSVSSGKENRCADGLKGETSSCSRDAPVVKNFRYDGSEETKKLDTYPSSRKFVNEVTFLKRNSLDDLDKRTESPSPQNDWRRERDAILAGRTGDRQSRGDEDLHVEPVPEKIRNYDTVSTLPSCWSPPTQYNESASNLKNVRHSNTTNKQHGESGHSSLSSGDDREDSSSQDLSRHSLRGSKHSASDIKVHKSMSSTDNPAVRKEGIHDVSSFSSSRSHLVSERLQGQSKESILSQETLVNRKIAQEPGDDTIPDLQRPGSPIRDTPRVQLRKFTDGSDSCAVRSSSEVNLREGSGSLKRNSYDFDREQRLKDWEKKRQERGRRLSDEIKVHNIRVSDMSAFTKSAEKKDTDEEPIWVLREPQASKAHFDGKRFSLQDIREDRGSQEDNMTKEDRKRRDEELDKKRKDTLERKQKEEKKELEDTKRKRAEDVERRYMEEQERRRREEAERKMIEEEKRRRLDEMEKRRKEEIERLKKEDEERIRKEAEKKRKEEEERRRKQEEEKERRKRELEKKRLEEEERRKEEEHRKREEERKKKEKEKEQKQKQKEEEKERKRKEDEERKRRRLEEEGMERKKKEEAEREKKKREEAERERKRKEEVEKAKKMEEMERKRKEEVENERKRREEAMKERKRIEEEEMERKCREEELKERKRKEEEENERKRREEELKEKKRKEEEEEKRKRMIEEEMEKKLRKEENERKKREEEEIARKKKEEESMQRKQKEEAEVEKKMKEEEEKERKRRETVENERKEEEEGDKKRKEDQDRKKKVEEEKERERREEKELKRNYKEIEKRQLEDEAGLKIQREEVESRPRDKEEIEGKLRMTVSGERRIQGNDEESIRKENEGGKQNDRESLSRVDRVSEDEQRNRKMTDEERKQTEEEERKIARQRREEEERIRRERDRMEIEKTKRRIAELKREREELQKQQLMRMQEMLNENGEGIVGEVKEEEKVKVETEEIVRISLDNIQDREHDSIAALDALLHGGRKRKIMEDSKAENSVVVHVGPENTMDLHASGRSITIESNQNTEVTEHQKSLQEIIEVEIGTEGKVNNQIATGTKESIAYLQNLTTRRQNSQTETDEPCVVLESDGRTDPHATPAGSDIGSSQQAKTTKPDQELLDQEYLDDNKSCNIDYTLVDSSGTYEVTDVEVTELEATDIESTDVYQSSSSSTAQNTDKCISDRFEETFVIAQEEEVVKGENESTLEKDTHMPTEEVYYDHTVKSAQHEIEFCTTPLRVTAASPDDRSNYNESQRIVGSSTVSSDFEPLPPPVPPHNVNPATLIHREYVDRVSSRRSPGSPSRRSPVSPKPSDEPTDATSNHEDRLGQMADLMDYADADPELMTPEEQQKLLSHNIFGSRTWAENNLLSDAEAKEVSQILSQNKDISDGVSFSCEQDPVSASKPLPDIAVHLLEEATRAPTPPVDYDDDDEEPSGVPVGQITSEGYVARTKEIHYEDGIHYFEDGHFWIEVPGLQEDEEDDDEIPESVAVHKPSKISFSTSPIQVYSTFSVTDYDRKNEDVDPVSASAEYELEKRVEKMDVFPVQIEKGDGGLGLSIIGMGVGADAGVEKLGIFVKTITPSGATDRDGRIKVNDQIIEVDGQSLVGVTQMFAASVLKNTSGTVNFLIGREQDPENSEVAMLIRQSLMADHERDERRRALGGPNYDSGSGGIFDNFSPPSEGDSPPSDENSRNNISQYDEVQGVNHYGESCDDEYGDAYGSCTSSPPVRMTSPLSDPYSHTIDRGELISNDELAIMSQHLIEVQHRNKIYEEEINILRSKINSMEKEVVDKADMTKSLQEATVRLKDLEEKLQSRQAEIAAYQDMLEQSQGQYIILEKKYYKAKKIIKEYQNRERDFLHREEYHITQLEEKDALYNSLVKALKDRVIQLEGDLMKAQQQAGLPVSVPADLNAQSSSFMHHSKLPNSNESPSSAVQKEPPRIPAALSTLDPDLSDTEAGDAQTSEDSKASTVERKIPLKEELDVAVPPHELLDVSFSKAKGELASRGGLANRQLPSLKKAGSSSSAGSFDRSLDDSIQDSQQCSTCTVTGSSNTVPTAVTATQTSSFSQHEEVFQQSVSASDSSTNKSTFSSSSSQQYVQTNIPPSSILHNGFGRPPPPYQPPQSQSQSPFSQSCHTSPSHSTAQHGEHSQFYHTYSEGSQHIQPVSTHSPHPSQPPPYQPPPSAPLSSHRSLVSSESITGRSEVPYRHPPPVARVQPVNRVDIPPEKPTTPTSPLHGSRTPQQQSLAHQLKSLLAERDFSHEQSYTGNSQPQSPVKKSPSSLMEDVRQAVLHADLSLGKKPIISGPIHVSSTAQVVSTGQFVQHRGSPSKTPGANSSSQQRANRDSGSWSPKLGRSSQHHSSSGVVAPSNTSGVVLLSQRPIDSSLPSVHNDDSNLSSSGDNLATGSLGSLVEDGSMTSFDSQTSPVQEKFRLPDLSREQLSVFDWSKEQVGQWLVVQGLESHVGKFVAAGITGPRLINIDTKDLKNLGLSTDEKNRIKRKVKELRQNIEKERKQIEKEKKEREKLQKKAEKLAEKAEKRRK